jgi:hypothetical protein
MTSSTQRRTVDAGHPVPAGHVGQALVMPQDGQHDHRDPARRQLAPPRPGPLQVAAQQISDETDRRAGQRQAALVDNLAGALGGLVSLGHT